MQTIQDYGSLLRELTTETDKVKKLKPERYILSTTVELTPNRKEQIIKVFEGYIKDYEDIIGKEDLNNLLGQYPEIEKKHFKLWLSGTNILDRILHSKIYNQTNFEEDAIKENMNIYVMNQSYNDALKIIEKHNFVIISGIPGIGKTTLARILVYRFFSNRR